MWTRIACGALIVGSTIGLPALSARTQSDDERAIRALTDRIETATARNDADALRTLWAPDYMFVNPAGQRLTAVDRLRMFRSGNIAVQHYTLDQETVRLYGTMALVFFRSTVAGGRGGLDISSQRHVTMVVVKRGGRWQAVSQQTSRILPSATTADLSVIHERLKPDAMTTSKGDEAEVRRVEQQIAEATKKDDAAALERLWAPEFVWIGPIGQILTRAQRLAPIRGGTITHTGEGYTIDQETIRLYGAAAVVMFRSTVAGTLDGKDITSQRNVTNVLVKSGGRWRAVVQHSTRIESR